MSDLSKIVLTSGLTVAGGVFVFTIGQLIQRFFIEPIQQRSTIISETAYLLIFYAYEYAPPMQQFRSRQLPLVKEIIDAFRKNASQLIATTNAIRGYNLVELWDLAPPQKDCMEAARYLIELSNSIRDTDSDENRKRREKIETLLRLKLE